MVSKEESLGSKNLKYLHFNIHVYSKVSLTRPIPFVGNNIVLTLLDFGKKTQSSETFSTIDKCLTSQHTTQNHVPNHAL